MDYRPPSFRQPRDYGVSLDGIFDAYLKNKAEKNAESLQMLDRGFRDQDVTPEALQRAAMPAPQGPLQPGQAPLEDPHVTAIRSYLERRKQAQELASQGHHLGLAKTASDISENADTAREKNAIAANIEKGGDVTKVERIGNVDYLVHTDNKGEKHYTAQTERVPAQHEFTARGFADKAQQAHNVLSALESTGYQPAQIGVAFQSIAPTLMQTNDYQKFDQARRQFINAVLRRESGAVISASEYDNYTRQYFPIAGDSPDVLKQKAKARELAIAGLASEGKRVESNLSQSAQPVGGSSLQQQAAALLAQRRANARPTGR